jgi:polar amino acid transport system substrate-binding protein
VQKRLLRFMLMILPMVPVQSFAAGLEAALVGDYRPLKAAEAESVAEGFEASWLSRLSEALGDEITVVETRSTTDLRSGDLDSGEAYYSSELAALAAGEAGPGEWTDLAGQPFCVTTGSRYAELVATRFNGIPRIYSSAAHALIGLKLGECQAVVDDRVLLEQIAILPEWRRYNRLLPALADTPLTLRVEAVDAALQQRIEQILASQQGRTALAEVTQHWVDEVAFQAYVLADTLDCH